MGDSEVEQAITDISIEKTVINDEPENVMLNKTLHSSMFVNKGMQKVEAATVILVQPNDDYSKVEKQIITDNGIEKDAVSDVSDRSKYSQSSRSLNTGMQEVETATVILIQPNDDSKAEKQIITDNGIEKISVNDESEHSKTSQSSRSLNAGMQEVEAATVILIQPNDDDSGVEKQVITDIRIEQTAVNEPEHLIDCEASQSSISLNTGMENVNPRTQILLKPNDFSDAEIQVIPDIGIEKAVENGASEHVILSEASQSSRSLNTVIQKVETTTEILIKPFDVNVNDSSEHMIDEASQSTRSVNTGLQKLEITTEILIKPFDDFSAFGINDETSQSHTSLKMEMMAVPQNLKDEVVVNDDSEYMIHNETIHEPTCVKTNEIDITQNSKDEHLNEKFVQLSVGNDDSLHMNPIETSGTSICLKTKKMTDLVVEQDIETDTKMVVVPQNSEDENTNEELIQSTVVNDDSVHIIQSATSHLSTCLKPETVVDMVLQQKVEAESKNLMQPIDVSEYVTNSDTVMPPTCMETETDDIPQNLKDGITTMNLDSNVGRRKHKKNKKKNNKKNVYQYENTDDSLEDHIFKDKNGITCCNLCNKRFPSNHSVRGHVNGNRHRKNQEYLDASRKSFKIFKSAVEKLVVNDTIQSCLQDFEMTVDEAAGIADDHDPDGGVDMVSEQIVEDISNISQSEDADQNKTKVSEIEYEDISVQDDGTFMCNLCGIPSVDKILLKGHLIGKKHRKNLALKSSPDYPWNKIIQLENGKKNHVQMISPDNFKCILCNVKKLKESQLISHLNAYDHQLALKLKYSDRNEDLTTFRLQHIWNEIFLAEGGKWRNIYFITGDTFRCVPCMLLLSATEVVSHVRGKKHLDIINSSDETLKNVQLQEEFKRIWNSMSPAIQTHETHFCIDSETTVFCTACNVRIPFSAPNIIDHTTGKPHMGLVVTHLMASPEVSLGMKTCLEETTPSVKESQQVSQCSASQQALIKALMPKQLQKKPKDIVPEVIHTDTKKEDTVEFDCLVCNMRLEGEGAWDHHIHTSKHTRTVERLLEEENDLNMQQCPICNAHVLCIKNSMDKHDCAMMTSKQTRSVVKRKRLRFRKKKDIEDDSSEPEGTPRIMVTGYPKGVNLDHLYKIFMEFGTVSYVALTVESAIIEFFEGEAVERAMKCPPSIGDTELIVEVLKRRIKKGQLNERVSLHEDIVPIFESEDTLKKKLESLTILNSSISIREICREVCEFLERVLQKPFSNCKAYCFGSRVSGLAFPDSDLDIFLDTGGMYYGKERQGAFIQEYIVSVVDSVLKDSEECNHVQPIPKARTPIVKFFHKPTGIKCDVAFRHGLGVENTKLLKFYLSLDKKVKPFILFLKYWASLNGLIGPQSITNYALSWLAIFYLQQEIELPSVHKLQTKYKGEIQTIGENSAESELPVSEGNGEGQVFYRSGSWDCSFTLDKNVYEPKAETMETNIVELLYGFFNYYCIFDYKKYVVCPLTGTTVEKNLFSNESIHDLPLAMGNYVYNVTNEKNAERFRYQTSFCVQDPFDLSHNLTKAVSPTLLRKFRILCQKSADLTAEIVRVMDIEESD